MDKPTAISQIRQTCKNIGMELMRVHPAVPALGEKTAQDEIYKSLFEITKHVEVIKKQLAKLEAGTTTPEL
jgi:thymidylate synthase ThyX